MQLTEILKQPDGFTPPDVTVKVEKVGDRKSGDGEYGEWSFQSLKIFGGGMLKLKNLPEFPAAREGRSVTIRANQSKAHGLTGLKVESREYNGQTYRELVVTGSAKWDWGATENGSSGTATAPELTVVKDLDVYADHVLAVALLAANVVGNLGIAQDSAAVQACFATICIDTKNRGILLPKPSTNGHQEEAPAAAVEQEERNPFDDDEENFFS